jgi:hypothetical protein
MAKQYVLPAEAEMGFREKRVGSDRMVRHPLPG